MKKLLLFMLLFAAATSSAQKIGIDGKGKSVYTQYSKDEAVFQISADEPLSLSYLFCPKRITYKQTEGGDTTLTKFSGKLLKVSMLNSEEYLTVKNLAKINPGIGIKIGYQTVWDKLIPQNMVTARSITFGANVTLKMENLKLYDSLALNKSWKYPFSYGVEGNVTYYFKSTTEFHKFLAFNFTAEKGWNTDELRDFQDISKTTLLPDIVALEEFDGKYGILTKADKLRLCFSTPLFYKKVSAIPYAVLSATSIDHPTFRFGVFGNVMTKKLIVTKFEIPSSIGIGIDWAHNDSKFGKANIVLKGSISLGKL